MGECIYARVVGKLRENQSGHWDDSREAKKSICWTARRVHTVWRFQHPLPRPEFLSRQKMLGRGKGRKGEACLLTLHSLELNIRTPGRGLMRGRGFRGATGKRGWLLLKHLKPRAEGFEMEILAKCAFRNPINRIACMWKPQTLNTLTRNKSSARRLTTAISHGTSPRGEQSSTVGSRWSANGESVSEIQYFWARKSQNRRAVWLLREGREIWGVDGAFASISWRRECVRGGVAPSANELPWLYKGFRHRSRRRHSQSVKSFTQRNDRELSCEG